MEFEIWTKAQQGERFFVVILFLLWAADTAKDPAGCFAPSAWQSSSVWLCQWKCEQLLPCHDHTGVFCGAALLIYSLFLFTKCLWLRQISDRMLIWRWKNGLTQITNQTTDIKTDTVSFNQEFWKYRKIWNNYHFTCCRLIFEQDN